MGKFHGKIGFVESRKENGVYEYSVIERLYDGDILQNHRRWDQAEKVIEDVAISNRIKIFADDYMRKNLGIMKYVEFMGSMWNIKSVDIDYPRIILIIGGLYNGPQA